MKNEPKKHRISLHWRAFGKEVIIAVLQIPLLGFGLYRLYQIRSRIATHWFEISDDDVCAMQGTQKKCLRLADISKIAVIQTGFDPYFKVARLYLSTGTQEIVIPGLFNASHLENLLDRAVKQEKKRLALQEELQAKRPKEKPGTLEKMNDLVGLWQQGLLTDEQFDEERKKFE